MAVYKKRNDRPNRKKKTEDLDEFQEELLHEESTTAKVFDTIEENTSIAEAWVQKNQKTIIGTLVAVAVVGLGYLLYQRFVLIPRENEGANELFFAQEFFDQALNATDDKVKDSLFTVSLKGGNGKYGFLEIIENYSGTKAANLANYSAGMAYMNQGNYEKAIEHLKKFNSPDEILGALALGNIGDAYSQQKNNAEALNFYKKAFEHSKNEFTTPIYLKKAGITAMLQNNNQEANKYFERIKDEFPNSEEARTIDILLGKINS
ncbi:tetratricopeptide repeat protein [Capnocytophaga cynodegmi]|uniref:TPR repeat-containing protein n=1 Tax=Capnocytophaga cynodegmi TaxID=28189 RepID=A0A0B7HT11_9FLAO|nr:tetratricopeptide repeat protein [Capnocytophaga cynodegmi]CEN40663.1 TPR repeat-containing protein [Capnocytophaga cynodegmi]CEN41085.1 TPR repeat-containing protein [Capnocytophaga cynodegmi]